MSNLKLIIGNQNYSTWSMRPWIFVKYHDLDIEVEKVALFTDQTKKKLAQHFTNGKVPFLIDDDLEIWDTIAILEYPAEKFPQTNGWPVDFKARAIARAVFAEMYASFSVLRNELPMNCKIFFPEYQLSDQLLIEINRISEIWNACRTRYGASGPWLFGEFSIADAMYAPVVMRFRSIALTLDSVSQEFCDVVNECSQVKQWIADGLQESEVIDEDELDSPSELLLS